MTPAPPTTETAEPPAELSEYVPTSFPGPIDLDLSRNEGVCCLDDQARQAIAANPASFDKYPDASALESLLAERFSIEPAQVLVTAGGDDAIQRLCQLAISQSNAPTPTALLHTPTFEMIELYCRSLGAAVESVPWTSAPFPVGAMTEKCTESCALVSLVSPNNPTGGVIPIDELIRIAEQAQQVGALVLADLAYVEFASADPTQQLLEFDNVVIVRTFSKAWGLAGLRVGYAIGNAELISRMRAIGAPYAVSGLSLAAAEQALRTGESEMIRRTEITKRVRTNLTETITRSGGSTELGQANFVLARFNNPTWIRGALAGLGIATRTFDDKPQLQDAIRISCPTQGGDLERVTLAIESATAPQAILFDLDGVLADVSRSYRRAIIETAASYGITIDNNDVETAKAQGDANNDWIVTHRLVQAAGSEANYDEVQSRFEQIYQGSNAKPGLKETESLLASRTWLESLAQRLPLAIVTGRPRRDANEFLDRFGLRPLFPVVITLDDAPSKPDPAPVRLAMQQLGITRAWMIGDTIDDITASRAAGVIPLGINPPQADPVRNTASLRQAGAARVLNTLEDIEELLP